MTQIEFGGQVAIVTGAGRGLGLSHARLLASRGARVVVNDVAGAPEAAAAIRDAGGEAVASDADISTPAGAKALVSLAVENFGTLDALVNNAGVGRFTTLSEATVEEYDLVRRSGLVARRGRNSSAASAVSAIIRVIGAASALTARGRGYGKERVYGSIP